MRGYPLYVCAFVLVAAMAFGQVGNGTITGTVTDPAGAVIPGAAVEAKNTATGVAFSAVSTSTGNYTVPDLPVGTYTVTVKAQGFKAYTHTNLAVAAAQTLREDAPLQVGNATEAVTVSAEATLLATETGDLAHNVTLDTMDQLPLLGIGTTNSGTSGFRNPYNVITTLPGASGYGVGGLFTINGLGGTSTPETMRIEGQDATSRIFGTYDYTQMAQPSVDSVQEIAFQTSNYAAEFGQAGSVVINMTMKSGTNQYHGSLYENFVNEDLNAGNPFSVSSAGEGKLAPRNRRNDFGGTLGGPIYIPKIYNGHNKTFFFWSYEEYLETNTYQFSDTVPAAAYLTGNFSAISANGNCSLCAAYGIPTAPLGGSQLDALGRPMFANEIYDPTSRAVNPANNLGYANPFPNNSIPLTRIDPISAKIAALFPAAQNSSLINNYTGIIGGNRYSAIPSMKIDHNLSDKDKLSFYYSENNTQSQISSPLGNADGLPTEIGGYRGTFIPTYTERLNYDRTLRPTLLLHIGGGYYHTSFSDKAPFTSFNPSSFGLSGFLIGRQFPSVTGMCAPPPGFGAVGCGGQGGMQNIGTSGQIQSLNYEEKPTFNANLTWIRGSHTYKVGAELYFEQPYTGSFAGVTLATGNGPTAQPFTPTNSFNGYTQGFGYASFLLGDYTSTLQTPQENYREGQAQLALFIQDSWKVTRKLTVDYGIRWDLATPEHEQYGRLGQLDELAANPNAGGHPGATRYASTCGCNFYPSSYPYAIGPRLGVAYQINPKTVFRGGWGVVYNFVGNPAGQTIGTNGVYPLAPVANNAQFVNDNTPGFIVQPTWPVTNPNIYPSQLGVLGAPGSFFAAGSEPYVPDPNQNRPPRVNQWSVGFQREITRNFIMEASYVANRAAWIPGPYGFLSQIPASTYAKYGLYPYPGTGPAGTNNLNDYLLLTQPISSTAVIQREASIGITNLLPYPGFPTGTSLQGVMYPFPQFPNLEPSVSPTGDSKYDSLQIKATKRFSHGLQAGGAFTWGQGFTSPLGVQDFFNPSANGQVLQQIPPRILTFNFIYTTPKASFLNKIENAIVKDWQVGGYANYQSGAFLAPPTSPTLNFLPSEDVRVPGQPLYNVSNINDIHSYNPYTDVVLNPNAWAPCPSNAACAAASSGAFGPAASVLYKDFRAPRTPIENANIGRNFRVKERMNLYIRAEFVNIFNRTIMAAPSTSNPQNPVVHGAGNGTILTSGFGVIDAYAAPGSQPAAAVAPVLEGRTGTIIARFSF
jgi:Carboxypeptidase regulatory-like domain